MSSVYVGIDLGTTFSVVCLFKDNEVFLLPINFKGDVEVARNYILPVHRVLPENKHYYLLPSYVAFDKKFVVGQRQVLGGVGSFKTLLGKSWDDLMGLQILEQIRDLFDLNCLQDGSSVNINLNNYGPISALNLSAILLKYIMERVTGLINCEVGGAVITVPAYFNDAERYATKVAANLAKIKLLRLINEPTAAALAYGIDHSKDGFYVVYDLGGGTFDVSLLRLSRGIFQVIATAGDTFLGGDNMDYALLKFIKNKFNVQISLARAQGIKEYLSFNLLYEEHGVVVSQEDLRLICLDFFKKTLKILVGVVEDSKIGSDNLLGLVLVGGSTLMPVLLSFLEENFVKFYVNCTIFKDLAANYAIAMGAARQAHALVYGSDHLLLDIVPLSLGVETVGGVVDVLIPRNSPIPMLCERQYTTYVNDQSCMYINIVQGEAEMASACRSLGRLEVAGILPGPAGVSRVNIEFCLDESCILTVRAFLEDVKGEISSYSLQVKPFAGLRACDFDNLLTTVESF